MTYRMRANVGPSFFDAMGRGDFMVARLVPIGDEWLLSGAQHLFPRSGRKEVLQTVAQLSLRRPDLVFRNPEKLKQGWELQKWERGRFIEFFGTDLVVFRGSELADRFDAYWQWRARQTVNGKRPQRSSQSHNVLTFELSDGLLQAETVALIYDEVEGLRFLAEFGLVEAVFDDPGLLADRDHRRAVLGYLNDDTVSPLPFRRLAQRNTEIASRVFQSLLKKPTFSWERDGERLLRRRKPGFFDGPVLPHVTPASAALIKAAGST